MGVVEGYLTGRGQDVLRRTLLLIDARHGVKDADRQVMAVFDDHGVSYQVGGPFLCRVVGVFR
jgi:GTP-binding protein EngB required for normal cell division